jgi:exopolysaccharide biosynthesis predicted pyruvyltransferase EpsI
MGVHVPHVLDPTLLLSAEQYEIALSKECLKYEYVLVYPMQHTPEINNVIKNIKNIIRLPVVVIVPINRNPWSFRNADKVIYDAGPSEFLRLIRDATYVCTNSFHGTIFSIIYHKNFITIPCPGTNTRLESILKQLNLECRLIKDSNNIDELVLNKVDYKVVDSIKSQLINNSFQYIIKSLN